MTQSQIKEAYVNAIQGKALLGGEPLVFHCNHYNLALQTTLLTPDYFNMAPVLVESATEVVYGCLSNLAKSLSLNNPEDVLKMAGGVFQLLGFGLIDFQEASDKGGRVSFPVSHYGCALKIANDGQPLSSPQNYFDLGYGLAALALAYGHPQEYYEGKMVHCQSTGSAKGIIEIQKREDEKYKIPKSVGLGIQNHGPIPERQVESNIDEPAVLKALSGLDFDGGEDGLIDRFGVILTRHFANYYNRISHIFSRRIGEHQGVEKSAHDLLKDAGHICGFYTFGGIMKSDEWYAVVHPMCKTREDWVHGIVAAVNSLGWGVWRIAELIPQKRLVIRVYNGYESCGYLGMYGKSQYPVEDLATGVVASLANLIYQADITSKPTLNPNFYEKLFGSEDCFFATQSKCRAMGDEYTEIVAEK